MLLFGGALLLGTQASGQNAPNRNLAPRTVVEQLEDGTLVERTTDGEILRATVAQQPGDTGGNIPNIQVPVYVPDGGKVLVTSRGNPFANDPQSQKLAAAEQAAAQQTRTLATQAQKAGSEEERADARKKLRDSVAKVFDLQQQRRAHEIAKIEERLGKLKDVMKKRDAAKDSIVDRRLDVLTGGVDELGWEETFPYSGRANVPYNSSLAPPQYGTGNLPVLNPQPPGPTLTPTTPAPATRPRPVPPAAPSLPEPATVPAPPAAPVAPRR
jgi:hypothetical protein